MSLWHPRHSSRPFTAQECGLWQSVQEASLCSPLTCSPDTRSWHSLQPMTGVASNDLVWHSPHFIEAIIGAFVSILWHSAQSEGGRNPAEWHRLHRIRLCLPSSSIGCQDILLAVTTVPSGMSGDRTGWVWQTLHSMLKTLPVFVTCRPSWHRKHPGQFRCPMLEG